MSAPSSRKPTAWRWIEPLSATVITLAVLGLAARGAGSVPPLGPAFDPGTGAWTSAADARLPRPEALHLAGLQRPATVTFERDGTAHIVAGTDHDLFLATGYLHARFRLFQMDLERRQGEGLLSQVVGPAALDSDEFELRLGLLRTARQEWRMVSPAGRLALTAYAQGVNDRIREDERTNALPLLFHMLAYTPAPWTPLDTLVVKGDMTQTLDFDDQPLNAAVLVRTLGERRTLSWFPILPADHQHPYDTGPFHRHRLAPIPAQQSVGLRDLSAITSLHSELASLGVLHTGGNSNNWAVDGSRTATGKPLMAGDPHLHQTLPAIWYQLTQDSPHYHVAGVSIPGTPMVLIGRNRHISWSLTNTQNEATLYYLERTDRAHPRQYYWRGAWRHMQRLTYRIPVKGGGSRRLEVDLTVHGPVMTDDRIPGRQIAVWWAGALPTHDLDALLSIDRASSFAQFRRALRGWYTPSQNFIYADDRNHIGLISAGYYPVVRSGAEWLPLPGTGGSDVVGTVPFRDIPQAYDPPDHILATANQRPVGPDYPYYIGTSMNSFDNGYRADRIYQVLQSKRRLTMHDMERLQNDVHDYLGMRLQPSILQAVPAARLSATEARARRALASWNGAMTADSTGATIWWSVLSWYIYDVFQPWWNHYHVPSGKFQELGVGPGQAPLVEDLERWTLHDPANPAYSLPDGRHRTAPDVIRRAFHQAVRRLARGLGSNVATWHWGRVHTRTFPSLAQISGLGYGPRPSGSDLWTVNAAGGEFQSQSGPSWRTIVDWGTGRAEGVYPGGQSENPASPWYENRIAPWWNGRYQPILSAAQARAQTGSVTWKMRP